MADRVVIVGSRRAKTLISMSEINQMIGRAGRKHDGKTYPVDILVEEYDFDHILDSLSNDHGMMVESAMSDIDTLAFHFLAEIVNGYIEDKESADNWFSKSFCHHLGGSFNFDEIFSYLHGFNAVEKNYNKIQATELGVASSKFYFHPADVFMWKNNFDQIFDLGLECDEVAPAWALGNLLSYRLTGDMSKLQYVSNDFCSRLPAGLDYFVGTMTNMICWWHTMGGPSVGKLNNLSYGLSDDFARIKSLLNYIDFKYAKWGMDEYFEDIQYRIKLNISSELVPLCKLRRISKSRAMHLHSLGIESLEDLKEGYENLQGEIDEKFWNDVCDIVGDK